MVGGSMGKWNQYFHLATIFSNSTNTLVIKVRISY